jgi:hypothetical protein
MIGVEYKDIVVLRKLMCIPSTCMMWSSRALYIVKEHSRLNVPLRR